MVVSRRITPGWLYAFAVLAGCGSALPAEDAVPFARVAPLLQKHCYGCHGSAKAKGELRIDKLDPSWRD